MIPATGDRRADSASTRWAAQHVDAADTGALPGLTRMSTFLRSVRPPDFQGVTFHEILAKSALNHVPDDARMLPGEWTVNPYRGCTHACSYCFARPSHSRLGLDIDGDFEREIVVKVNIAQVLRRELAGKRRLPPRVAFGTNTDAYQRAEGRYALMPEVIGALKDFRVPFSILTKGTLIRRDLSLLAEAASRTTVNLGVSISVGDEELQQSLEPGTATTKARLATVRAIRDAGMDCTVFMAPVLPRLTDDTAHLEGLVRSIAAAGATNVLFTPLHLESGVRQVFMNWLRREHPELLPTYGRLYSAGSEVSPGYRLWLSNRIRPLFAAHGLPDPDAATRDRFALDGQSGRPAALPPEPPTLF